MGLRYGLATLLVVSVGLSGCNGERRITRSMTWQCLPEMDEASYPGAQTVKFWFASNPHYFEIVPAKHLCEDLRASGKAEVSVRFVLYQGWRRSGYNIEAIDGRFYAPAAGWGSNGVENVGSGGSGINPLQ